MKKFLALIIATLMLMSFAGCGTSETPTEDAPLSDEVTSENPMFVYMGYWIEIDGVNYGASQIRVTEDAQTVAGKGYFVLNVVNRHVYYMYEDGTGHYATGHTIDTGLVYNGEIKQHGVVIAPAVEG